MGKCSQKVGRGQEKKTLHLNKIRCVHGTEIALISECDTVYFFIPFLHSPNCL